MTTKNLLRLFVALGLMTIVGGAITLGLSAESGTDEAISPTPLQIQISPSTLASPSNAQLARGPKVVEDSL